MLRQQLCGVRIPDRFNRQLSLVAKSGLVVLGDFIKLSDCSSESLRCAELKEASIPLVLFRVEHVLGHPVKANIGEGRQIMECGGSVECRSEWDARPDVTRATESAIYDVCVQCNDLVGSAIRLPVKMNPGPSGVSTPRQDIDEVAEFHVEIRPIGHGL